MNRQKAGVFSGPFNPTHVEHLALANYFCEYEGLDETWFMMSPQNPLKAQKKLWNDELRLELVESSISSYPHFQISDFEFHLPYPSYSIYTLEKLHEAFPDHELYFIISSDSWERFGYWYQSKRIIREDQILIYPRSDSPVKGGGLPGTACLIHSPVFEISSTLIREALDARKDARYFMHPKARETIQFTPSIGEEQ